MISNSMYFMEYI